MQPSGLKGLYLLSLLTFLVVVALLAMSFSSKLGYSASSGSATKAGFFDSQNAMVTGIVTNVKNDVLTVQNKKGMKQDFRAAKTLMVMGATPPTPGQSADLSKIEVGKEYLINLVANGEDLEVSNLMSTANILPPASGAPAPAKAVTPPATNSATPTKPAAAAPSTNP